MFATSFASCSSWCRPLIDRQIKKKRKERQKERNRLEASPLHSCGRFFIDLNALTASRKEKKKAARHYGPEQKKHTEKTAIGSFTFPQAREWAKWASERTSERYEWMSKTSSVEHAHKWVVQKNEQTNERVAKYFSLDSWLFLTIVQPKHQQPLYNLLYWLLTPTDSIV